MKELSYLQLQEPEHQNTFKVSYYTPEDIDEKIVQNEITQRLLRLQISTTISISINHIDHFGYLDVLPASATKRHALQYLEKYFNLNTENIIYAGDSGNDIEPLTFGYKSIVVKNASEPFKEQVKTVASQKRVLEKVYFAKGDYDGMNGNYAAGILEGINFFGYIQ